MKLSVAVICVIECYYSRRPIKLPNIGTCQPLHQIKVSASNFERLSQISQRIKFVTKKKNILNYDFAELIPKAALEGANG